MLNLFFKIFENERNLANFGYAFMAIFHTTLKTFPSYGLESSQEQYFQKCKNVKKNVKKCKKM